MGNLGTNATSKRVQQEEVPVLKCHNNLKRESLYLKKVKESDRYVYSLNFDFSCTFDCIITIQLCASEYRSSKKGSPTVYFYTPPEISNGIAKYKFSARARHEFPFKAFIIDFSKYDLKEMTTFKEDEYYPIVITIESCPRFTPSKHEYVAPQQCQITYGSFIVNSQGDYCLLPKKQCLQFQNKIFKIEDIYGLSTKDEGSFSDEAMKECIICYSNPKNTVVYPCKHICLCNACAQVVRMQSSKCPICRLEAEKFITVQIDKPGNSDSECM
ncbi:unnamed protein product [Moneuplotes crassus]|uniref:RING-type E3 ubiquitin transferase n=1 Tax=Euplotes crassus TaxID=5936 RepID=A0AAD2D104_EUPCR|nr:unnamed protein product [Moneuplotes crassus]